MPFPLRARPQRGTAGAKGLDEKQHDEISDRESGDLLVKWAAHIARRRRGCSPIRSSEQHFFRPVMFTIDQISPHILLDIKEDFGEMNGGTDNERNSR